MAIKYCRIRDRIKHSPSKSSTKLSLAASLKTNSAHVYVAPQPGLIESDRLAEPDGKPCTDEIVVGSVIEADARTHVPLNVVVKKNSETTIEVMF